MTAIIRVDPDDELPMILDRLPAGGSCILVLPPQARALTSVVGAKLVQRRAQTLGCMIAVVTDDAAFLAHARAAGLAVAENVEAAQRLLLPSRGAKKEETVVMDAILPHLPMMGRALEETLVMPTTTAPTTRQDDSTAQRPQTRARSDAKPVSDDGARRPSSRRGARTGAPVRRAGSQATPQNTRPSKQRPHRGGPLGTLITAILAIVPLILLIGLIVYLLGEMLNPSASFTLHPRILSLSGQATVRAELNLPAAKRTTTLIGMALIDQRAAESLTLPLNKITSVPDKPATGELMLRNFTKQPLLVKAGTQFTTDLNKMTFVSLHDVTLPQAIETFTSTNYGTGKVDIQAVIGGTVGNLPPGSIKNVPASYQGALDISQASPTTGGTVRQVHVVDPGDEARLSGAAFASLQQQAINAIVRSRGDVEVWPLSVQHSSVNPVISADGKQATAQLTVLVHAAYVHRVDLQPAAQASLQAALAAQHTPLLAQPPLNWHATWSTISATTQEIALQTTGYTEAVPNVAKLLAALSGLKRSDALKYLNARQDLTISDFSLSPPWSDRLPGDVSRIHVTTGTPQ